MSLRAGNRVGSYEIVSLIGSGAMGEVYCARDARLRREIAIKVLPAAFAKDAERMRRFELEAQAAGRLNHPNVLAIYDIGLHEGSPYLVSELLEGESLRSRLSGGKLSPQKAVDYARQIAAGLAAAHAAGIVHRDLKPENLFVTKDGRVKILDFGLAKVRQVPGSVEETQALDTLPGTVLGTVGYMSPEQVRGETVDGRSDIFSFGCVLQEMLTGERPFKGDSSVETMNAILKEERPPLPADGTWAPALDRIIGHCLEKNPDERFQSARDLAFDLASLSEISQLGSGAVKPLPPKTRVRRRALAASALMALVILSSGAYFAGRLSVPSAHTVFHRLTYRRGMISSARFAPDGNTIVYSANWEDDPSDIFVVRPDSPESRALGFSRAELLAISPSSELALSLSPRFFYTPFAPRGVMAWAPFSGGAPRAMEEAITFADWSRDGREMALARETDSGVQLELPAGHVVYRTAGYVSSLRISPAGDRVAFLDHPLALDNAGSVAVVDRSGQKKTLTRQFSSTEGLAWSNNGSEIWFTGSADGARQDLWAVTLDGRMRLVHRQSGSIAIRDISPDGKVLITNMEWRQKMMFRGPSDTRERELSWLDWSLPTDISPDGKLIVFSETGEGVAGNQVVYLRETSGAPAAKLGPGTLASFSPDGQTVVSVDPNDSEITLYPVGPGRPKRIALKGYTIASAGLLEDGRIWFDGNEPSHGRRLYLTTLEGAAPRAVTPEGTQSASRSTKAHPKHLVVRAGSKTLLYPVDGGEPEVIRGIEEGERIAAWALDGQSFLVFQRRDLPTKVYRVDYGTGRRQFVQEIAPNERAGVGRTGINLIMTPDGKSYVYSTQQTLSELHLVEGLR
jgi:serine/threonine protein kinase